MIYEGLKYQDSKFASVQDDLTVEEALQININGEPFTVIMRSPGDENEQVLGLLHAERIIKGSFNGAIHHTKTNDLGYITEVDVEVDPSALGDGYLSQRSLLSVSSCGICGKQELGDLHLDGPALPTEEQFDPAILSSLYDKMEKAQATFQSTGGSHAAAAFSSKGELLAFKEDVGRHNAVDKVVGQLLLKGQLSEARILLVSGRISYEIVAKCFMARFPVLAAVSAPSTLSVDFAKELGITLFAFSRKGRTTCYSHPVRIKM